MFNFDHAKVTSMKTLSINRLILAIGIPALIIMVLFALTKTQLLIEKPTIGAFAISFDLLITVPCIYYIIIRNSKISPLTLFPMVIATMWLPHWYSRAKTNIIWNCSNDMPFHWLNLVLSYWLSEGSADLSDLIRWLAKLNTISTPFYN